jgi:hypothetical protein
MHTVQAMHDLRARLMSQISRKKNHGVPTDGPILGDHGCAGPQQHSPRPRPESTTRGVEEGA